MAHSETCIICGTGFVKVRNAKTCSSECSAQHLRNRNKLMPVCIVCGNFFTLNKNKQTCSKECSDANNVTYRTKPVVIVYCPTCQLPFERKGRRKYCSVKCSRGQYVGVHKKSGQKKCQRCGALTHHRFNCSVCWGIIEGSVGSTFMEEYRL